MTRKEAAEQLKDFAYKCDDNALSVEACEMAIKSLEQNPYDVLAEYKTFNNETGEIRMEIKLVKIKNFYYIMQNGELIQKFASWLKAKQALNEIYGMDCYLEKSLDYYEVVR